MKAGENRNTTKAVIARMRVRVIIMFVFGCQVSAAAAALPSLSSPWRRPRHTSLGPRKEGLALENLLACDSQWRQL